MNRVMIITALVVGLMSSGCAGKFRGGDMSSHMFNKYDQTEEGLVTESSYIEVAISRFERTDDNGDNNVTKKESEESRFGQFMPGVMEHWFDKNDINSDNIVEKPEMLTTTSKEFIAMDTNKDSLLSKDEMKVYRKNEIFDVVDTNNDGVVTREEFQKSKSPFEKR
ncbi:MAG: hypothetical protein U9O83_05420 [Campylobacterota bacterium]|nr:hypothetical protein [Campylobacterota bacterium]